MGFLSRLFGNDELQVTLNHMAVVSHTVEAMAGYDEIENALLGLTLDSVKNRRRHVLSLTISGYGQDTRELHEIPDVCQWAHGLQEKLPVAFYFMDVPSQKRYIGWLCGPMSVADISTPQFQNRFREQRISCVVNGLVFGEAYLTKAGAPPDFIAAVRKSDIARQPG